MAAQRDDLVTLYDQAPLNARYWVSISLAITISIFDYFDYFIVGFLVAVLAPPIMAVAMVSVGVTTCVIATSLDHRVVLS